MKHLYNSKITKVRWFVERFGASEIILKPIRVIFAPLIIPSLPKETFQFKGATLECFYARYNMTWACERCVEVPIARYYLSKANSASTLEVGNVLSHYGPVQHTILDKFEKAQGLINEDITSYSPAKPFDLILSISTFEHIGFDDQAETTSRLKILETISHCLKMLTPNGKLVFSVPLGYNPELNEMIRANEIDATCYFLKRVGPQKWNECSKEEALASPYKSKFPYANAIMVAEAGRAAS